MTEAAWYETPESLADRYHDRDWKLAYQYPGHSVVYRLTRSGTTDLFLKLQPAGDYPSLADEAVRTRWARNYLTVPEVVDTGVAGPTEWLVSVALPGVDGTHVDCLGQPTRLVRGLAVGLRAFHDAAPVADCPYAFRLDAALRQARSRLASGRSTSDLGFHDEHLDLSPAQVLDILEGQRPDAEDLVVCHGDYCPPNILFEDGAPVGYLDLGELGVACRWWDLAVATWSVTWNLGPGYEEQFLSDYGIEHDMARTRYYRLMYDAVG